MSTTDAIGERFIEMVGDRARSMVDVLYRLKELNDLYTADDIASWLSGVVTDPATEIVPGTHVIPNEVTNAMYTIGEIIGLLEGSDKAHLANLMRMINESQLSR